MSVAAEHIGLSWRIVCEGPLTLASAAEFRERLLEWLPTGDSLELNLEGASEVDLAGVQLLWSAMREAERKRVAIRCRVSEVVACATRDAGFPPLPGAPGA
jgi:ABC-type transporter Mla MlaB component